MSFGVPLTTNPKWFPDFEPDPFSCFSVTPRTDTKGLAPHTRPPARLGISKNGGPLEHGWILERTFPNQRELLFLEQPQL